MTQATDVVLDGAGYMVAGDYRRAQDGIAEGRTGRIKQTDFFGGQHRAYQLERDRAWDSLGVGPVHGGQAVEPWPYFTDVTLDAATPLVSASFGGKIPAALVGDFVFYAVGRYLYRTAPVNAGAWATPVQVYDTGATGRDITGVTGYGDSILICAGNTGQQVATVPYPNGTTVGGATVLLAGEKGGNVVSYAGYAAWNDMRSTTILDASQSQVRMVTGSGVDNRRLDAKVRGLTVAGAKIFAITNIGLYAFDGQVGERQVHNPAYTAADPNETDPPTITALRWQGEFQPFHQQGNGTTGTTTASCWATAERSTPGSGRK